MKNSTYGIAFLLRKTNVTLEEIGKLSIVQFQKLYAEVSFQESVSEYQSASYVANILAAIANTIPRKTSKIYKAKDFMAFKEPRRTGADAPPDERAELEALATKFKIRLPAREIIDL